MSAVEPVAPSGDAIIEYDRSNLALYAALLEAEDAGTPWQEAAAGLMKLDTSDCDAKACWRSHLDRARWIVGEGMFSAILAFGHPPKADGK